MLIGSFRVGDVLVQSKDAMAVLARSIDWAVEAKDGEKELQELRSAVQEMIVNSRGVPRNRYRMVNDGVIGS